jgi:hypothetical protein
MIREPHFSVLRGGVLYFYEGRLDITMLGKLFAAQIVASKHTFFKRSNFVLPDHNIWHLLYFFRMRNIDRIPPCFFDMTTEHY